MAPDSDNQMPGGFRIFRQALLDLNAEVSDALGAALQVDTAPDMTQRASAFSLLLSDFYYLLQWLWRDHQHLETTQAEWLSAMDAWLDQVNGEEPSEISVQSRKRLWRELISTQAFAQQLDDILKPCPRSLVLLLDHDSLQGTSHASALVTLLQQTAVWAVGQNPLDWRLPHQRLHELSSLLGAAHVAQAPRVATIGQSVRLQRLVQGQSGTEPGNMPLDMSADLAALLAELDGLIGLGAVKAEVRSLVNLLQLKRLRASRGLPALDVTRHMVFHGGPGTGKTTVARLLAKIFQVLGVLKKGHLVETDRSGLVAAYVGQTALKVKRVVNQADEGVLFIDEAYALARGENDFGSEAIETLLKLMEDRRDSLVVIVAGYTERMQAFIQSNPGLKSRFTRYFNFDDYDVGQLTHILLRMVEQHGMCLTPQAWQTVHHLLLDAAHRKAMESGNARFVRNCFEKSTMAQANRLAVQTDISDEDLCTLTDQDIDWALSESLRELG